MPPTLDQELREAFRTDQPTPEMMTVFRQMRDGTHIDIGVNPLLTFYLVSTLQMALRNPNFPATLAEQMELLASGLQAALGKVYPLAGKMLEFGWHPEFDVEGQSDAS